jgi:hypothetical protein
MVASRASRQILSQRMGEVSGQPRSIMAKPWPTARDNV